VYEIIIIIIIIITLSAQAHYSACTIYIAHAGIIAQDGFKVQASAPTPKKQLRRLRPRPKNGSGAPACDGGPAHSLKADKSVSSSGVL
jgi:hypothetical protein